LQGAAPAAAIKAAVEPYGAGCAAFPAQVEINHNGFARWLKTKVGYRLRCGSVEQAQHCNGNQCKKNWQGVFSHASFLNIFGRLRRK